MKHKILTLMMFAVAGAPAMAQDLRNQAFEAQVFHTEAGKPMQLVELSQKEMKETEGAVAPFILGALIGGNIGAWSNHAITRHRTGQWASTRSTVASAAGGMIGGGYTNAMLRGAGIATNPFARAAWQNGNAAGNVVIRGNGAALGQSSAAAMGKYKK